MRRIQLIALLEHALRPEGTRASVQWSVDAVMSVLDDHTTPRYIIRRIDGQPVTEIEGVAQREVEVDGPDDFAAITEGGRMAHGAQPGEYAIDRCATLDTVTRTLPTAAEMPGTMAMNFDPSPTHLKAVN